MRGLETGGRRESLGGGADVLGLDNCRDGAVCGEAAEHLVKEGAAEATALVCGMGAYRLDLANSPRGVEPTDAEAGQSAIRRNGHQIEIEAVRGHPERAAPPCGRHGVAAEGGAVERHIVVQFGGAGQRADGVAGARADEHIERGPRRLPGREPEQRSIGGDAAAGICREGERRRADALRRQGRSIR